MNRAVFLDRDGTVIRDIPYLGDPRGTELLPNAGKALAHMKAHGYRLVLITNQSGIGRGLIDAAAVAAVHDRLHELLAPFDVQFDAIKFCPHHPDDGCTCRKPEPAMILEAASDLQIDCAASWMIGDMATDVEAGCRAGCRTVLISDDTPDAEDGRTAKDLAGVAYIILDDS